MPVTGVVGQVNAPVPETGTPHEPIVAPGPIPVVIVIPGVNPVPDTTTDTPLGPWFGLSVIFGVVTVYVAVGIWPVPASVA